MPWAEWVGINPTTGVGLVAIIILMAFGWRPMKSFGKRATEKNEADADEEASRRKAIRRGDDQDDRWYHVAQRAETDKEAAIVERDKAREEKHKAANEAQTTIARMQLESIAEVRKAERAAEDRIAELTTNFGETLAARDATIARIMAEQAEDRASHRECIARNESLSAEVTRLSEILNRRMDRQGFDPAKTDAGV